MIQPHLQVRLPYMTSPQSQSPTFADRAPQKVLAAPLVLLPVV